MPAGLGARDSLRLEAGLCLYGNDLDERTNPVAANLGFAIGKRRRRDWDFLGGTAVRAMLEAGPAEKLVGIRLEGRAPARAGVVIHRPGGEVVGPRHLRPVRAQPERSGRAWLRSAAGCAAPGTALHLIVRDKPLPGVVTALPFTPHRYAR